MKMCRNARQQKSDRSTGTVIIILLKILSINRQGDRAHCTRNIVAVMLGSSNKRSAIL